MKGHPITAALRPTSAMEPSSTRRKRSWVANRGTLHERDQAGGPGNHRLPVPDSAMSACDNVSARMNRPLPAARSATSACPRLNLWPNRILPANGPTVPPTVTPSTPIPTTIMTSLRTPFWNSSSRPALTSVESFGSNAACTAWNNRIGSRDKKSPTMKSATRPRCFGFASTWAPRNGA